MDNSFCIYTGEIGKMKKDFFARIWSKPPIFEYVKKVLFWLIFYGFLISMKKLKNRLFVKKRKKYLKCEFQKTCTFEVTCWKMIHNFQIKNRRRFVILVWQSFFDFFGFFVKNVLSIEREVFFFFVFKKKLSNWTPVWGGGEEKFIFQNQLFGLLVVKPKVHFFHNRYRRLRVNESILYKFYCVWGARAPIFVNGD